MGSTENEIHEPSILGTLRGFDGRTVDGLDVFVTAGPTQSEHCRTSVDDSGRFLVRLAGAADAGEVVQLVVIDRGSAAEVARHPVVIPAGSKLVEADFNVDRSRSDLTGAGLIGKRPAIARPRAGMVPLLWRKQVAEMLIGRQPDRGGVPLVPHWVNRHIAQLHELTTMARRILAGDVTKADRFAELVGFKRRYGSPAQSGDAELDHRIGFEPSGSLRSLGRRGGRYTGQRPCAFDQRSAIEVALAGLYLDAYHAEVLGDLTQPGAFSEHASIHLVQSYAELDEFGGAVVELAHGRISKRTFVDLAFRGKPGAGAEPIDLGESGHGSQDRTSRPTMERSIEATEFGGQMDLSGFDLPNECPDLWIDCVEEIAGFAAGYRPPSLCSPEIHIGSISPKAVCKGGEDVELTIHPVAGETFNGDGVSCRIVLGRGQQRTYLNVVSFADDKVVATLDEANRSGCIGFRGTNGGGSGANVGFINSCMKMHRIHNRALEGLLTPNLGTLRAIECLDDGRNQLSVVGEPEVRGLAATGGTIDNASSSTTTGDSIIHVAEGCRDVLLEWRFDFGQESQWVSAAQFIDVVVSDGSGATLATAAGGVGSLMVDQEASETYTVTATARVGSDLCGVATGTIVIERFQQARLSVPDMLQIGETSQVQASISCPAPAGGLPIAITSSAPDRLTLTGPTVIDAGATSLTMTATAVGQGCEMVALSIEAEGHRSGQSTVDVYDVPVIGDISPASVVVCEDFELTIVGHCFSTDQTMVRAYHDDVIETLDVVSVTPTEIVATGQDLAPGSWIIRVWSRGLQSDAAVLNAVAPPPQIEQFVVDVVGQQNGDELDATGTFIPCLQNWIAVGYDVTRAKRVRIWFDDIEMVDEAFGECGGDTADSFTMLTEHGGTMRIEASPVGGGVPVTDEREFGEPGAKTFTVRNNTSRDLVIWRIEGLYEDASDIPHDNETHTLEPNEDVELTFDDCEFYQVVAIEKAMAIDEDKDPEGDAIEIAHLRIELGVFVGDEDGEELSTTIIQ